MKVVEALPKRYHLVNVDTCMRCTLCADSCPTYTASGDLNVAPALRVRLLK
ncbi:MAG: hypothetical protein DRJ97_07785, partial [Thermoprotei archaeon]